MARGGSIDCDLLIVGGGMVGLTMGIASAVAGLAVVVVDREAPESQLAEPYDGRSSAIARGSQQVFEGLGIWPLMAAQAQPITDIRVSDGRAGPPGGLGWAAGLFLHYDSRQVGGVPLGYIVENRVTREALVGRAKQLPSLSWLAPEVLVAVERTTTGVTARTAAGVAITARLVVAADGRNSALRRAAGIGVQSWDYPQSGIVCSVGHELPHEGVAHEHFLPAGPFALLPMTDGPLVEGGPIMHRSSLVWTEQRAVADKVTKLGDAAFAEELMRRFGDSLGDLQVRGRRWCYPLGLLHAKRYLARRLVLIGDAAHAIHPIAGQGLNLGIRDVAALAETLVDAARLGLDIGQEDQLERYERWRRFDATALVTVTDALNRLFSNDLPPVRVARDLGLATVDRLPGVKRLFMRHAMGLIGDLPRLVRGEPL